jgi:hypothetical protein
MHHEDSELVEVLYEQQKKALVHVFNELLVEFSAVSVTSIIDAVKTVRRNGERSPYKTLHAARELLRAQQRAGDERSSAPPTPAQARET